MPAPQHPAPPTRSWGSRLGEGAAMSVTMFLLRLVMIAAHLFAPEPILATITAALLFGAFWVLIALVWDVLRARYAKR